VHKTNGLERSKYALLRRTRVATLFPNEASLVRLATMRAAEIDFLPRETCQISRISLTPPDSGMHSQV
jgi:transposase-like protein